MCPNAACAAEFSASENMKNGSFLLYIPLQSQLKDLFANKDIAQSQLTKRRMRKDILDDNFDGAAMQKFIEEGKVGPNDFTLLWNCDGVPVSKSSGYLPLVKESEELAQGFDWVDPATVNAVNFAGLIFQVWQHKTYICG